MPDTPSQKVFLKESISESLQTIIQIDQKQKALTEEVKSVCRRRRGYPTTEELDKVGSFRENQVWPLLKNCGEAANVIDAIQATLDVLTGRAKPPESEELILSYTETEAPKLEEPLLSCTEIESEAEQASGCRFNYERYQEALNILREKLKHVETEVRISESHCNTKLNQTV